ncbi:hypothetical protein ACFRI7_14290 [Streptomyces sp. NPDC056716]|uniref:hypothetical protein n=1 Tax=unclassified Streptomyces TaxID=2593676 RepID=UPI0036B6E506
MFARVLRRAGITFPEYVSIGHLDADLTDSRSIEGRVDSLFRVHAVDDTGGFLLVVESPDKREPVRRDNWTYYLAYLYAKYRLPAILLVLCRDKATAAWAAEPIRIGRRFHTTIEVCPLVLGPGNLPTITDPGEAARDLPLAVFSAFAHAKDPGLPVILEALVAGMETWSPDGTDIGDGMSVDDWAEYVEIGLGEGPARDLWRQLMGKWSPKFPGSGTLLEEVWLAGREEGEAKGRAVGRAEGRADGRVEGILRILIGRGIEVSAPVRQRIIGCTDLDVLGVWFDRSLSVTTAEELLVETDAQR